MKRRILGLAFLLWLVGWVPATAQPKADDEHIPIEQYYYNAFFEQPWRLVNSYRGVCAQTALVLGADALLVLLLRRRRRA